MIEAFFLSFWTLFTIVNPMGAIGPFLSMTGSYSESKRYQTAVRASYLAAVVLCVVALVGSFFFRSLGLTIPALRIAGGILLLLVAIDMLNVRRSRVKGTAEEDEEAAGREDIAVFPLSVPLLSGPGAIATILVLVDKMQHWTEYFVLFASIFLTCALAGFILVKAEWIQKILGRIGVNILSRLMGLVLASTAVQFILDGLKEGLFTK
jgi:multiple antibiotic resistance protein